MEQEISNKFNLILGNIIRIHHLCFQSKKPQEIFEHFFSAPANHQGLTEHKIVLRNRVNESF